MMAGLLRGLGRRARRSAVPGAAALVLLAAAAPPARAELPSEARRLETALAGVTGIEATFVQIREVALTGEEIQARGTLAFKPPHAFRLDYVTPEPQQLVIRGDSLWVILPSENQAQRYPFSAGAPGSEIFLLFGGHHQSLEDAFVITQESWGDYENALHLVPRQADPGYPLEDMRLILGKSGLPEKLFFREVTGDTVVFTFTRVVRNPRDIDALVALRIPAGMEVIDGTPTGMGVGEGWDEAPR